MRPGGGWRTALAVLVCGLGVASAAHGQCMLANPSFELAGASGAVFAGWSQFGSVGSSAIATHGAVAARVSGPSTGGWDVSGYWQPLDCAPGQQWTVGVDVRPTSLRPLVGGCRAIVNIEWRNAANALISYESHVVADPSTPRDTSLRATFQSGPAPAGTVSARLLLGVLQSPTDPSPDVIYDRATFVKLTSPSLDELQWSDFPGTQTLAFSGYQWRVKGTGYYGPGPNLFSSAGDAVWVDGAGDLHLTIRQVGGAWYSTEVALTQALGYGDYVFTTLGRLDNFDPVTVLGLFVWEYGPCYDNAFLWWNPYNEFDIEYSRWGSPANPDAQFVAQPADYPGNRHQFNATFSDTSRVSHAFRWLSDRVECRTWRGGPLDESPATTLNTWTYRGPHIPRPDQPRVHMNLWQNNGTPAVPQEAVIEQFAFVSANGALVGVPATRPPPAGVTLSLAGPNPFRASTTLRYAAPAAGDASITVFDVAGRAVRTLLAGPVTAGEHLLAWDGRDDAGRTAPPGLYLCRCRFGATSATARLIRLR